MKTGSSPAEVRQPVATAAEPCVALAEVARPHGVRGELRLRVYNPSSDVLLSQRAVFLVTGDSRRKVSVRAARRGPKNSVLMKLAGVDDREAAEALRGAVVEVPKAALPPADDDEHYVVDLIGCEVWHGDTLIGRVRDVRSYPTCDTLLIERPGQDALEVPMTERSVANVDVAGARIDLSELDPL